MVINTLVVANVFTGPMPKETDEWLADNFCLSRILRVAEPAPLPEGRNLAIQDGLSCALPTDEWVWFIDNDVTIIPAGMEQFLALPGDVVSCHCRMPFDSAWCRPDAFHDHFWRCRLDVLRSIPYPWFTDALPNGGKPSCECMTFRERVLVKGYSVQWGGWCEHVSARSWMR